jgi:hypothetical protein
MHGDMASREPARLVTTNIAEDFTTNNSQSNR